MLDEAESASSKGGTVSSPVKFLARRVVHWLVWSASGYLEGAFVT